MTQDAILVLQALFQMIWSLFTSWHIPGTNTTPAAWAMFMLFSVLILRVLRRFFSVNGDNDHFDKER